MSLISKALSEKSGVSKLLWTLGHPVALLVNQMMKWDCISVGAGGVVRRADAEPRVSHRHQDRHPFRPVRQGGALVSGKKEPIMERDRWDEGRELM